MSRTTPCLASPACGEEGASSPCLTDLARSQPSLQQGVLLCPLDDLQGTNREETKALGVPVSYFYLWNIEEFRRDLRERNPNHGILVCVAR